MKLLILTIDHVHRMNYEKLSQAHREKDADIIIASLLIDEKRAGAFRLMKIDEECCLVGFAEKSKGQHVKEMKFDTPILGLDDERVKEMSFIASMSVYVIKKNMLQLRREEFSAAKDFESEVILAATIMELRVQAVLFYGFCENIPTMGAFYNASLQMIERPTNDFSFYDRLSPVVTQTSQPLSPTYVMLGAYIANTVIGLGCFIKRFSIDMEAIIENSIVMGADYYKVYGNRRHIFARRMTLPIGIGNYQPGRGARGIKGSCMDNQR